MPRYRLDIEYDGGGFSGWQRQTNALSVQQVLEEAVRKLTGAPADVVCAGRTDAGVHALGQVAHVDLPRDYASDTVRDALNFHVRPQALTVLAVRPVDEDFHARFSAVGRSYLYRILNRRTPPSILRGRVWWVPVPLDSDKMAEAALRLLGRHDFSSFRAAACQASSPVRTMDRLEVTRDGDEIGIRAEARSFLHHQVRNMVGTLKLVGGGRWSADDVTAALAAKDRRAAGPTAPPEGLYLAEVRY